MMGGRAARLNSGSRDLRREALVAAMEVGVGRPPNCWATSCQPGQSHSLL